MLLLLYSCDGKAVRPLPYDLLLFTVLCCLHYTPKMVTDVLKAMLDLYLIIYCCLVCCSMVVMVLVWFLLLLVLGRAWLDLSLRNFALLSVGCVVLALFLLMLLLRPFPETLCCGGW